MWEGLAVILLILIPIAIAYYVLTEYWWAVLIIIPVVLLIRKEMKQEKAAKEWEAKMRLANEREKQRQLEAETRAESERARIVLLKAQAEADALHRQMLAEQVRVQMELQKDVATEKAKAQVFAEIESIAPYDPLNTPLGAAIKSGTEEEKYNALCEVNLLMWAARAVSEYHTIDSLRLPVADADIKRDQRCVFTDDAEVEAAIYRMCKLDASQSATLIPKLLELQFLIPAKKGSGYTARLTANEYKEFERCYENHLLLIQGQEPKYNWMDYVALPGDDPDMDNLSGEEFEDFCIDLLETNGFSDVRKTKQSGDHGIDILAEKDGVLYAIQCKCYSSNVGNAAVQQVYSGKGLYDADVAVVMTNSHFTRQAIADANRLRVRLWDREKLEEMQ